VKDIKTKRVGIE